MTREDLDVLVRLQHLDADGEPIPAHRPARRTDADGDRVAAGLAPRARSGALRAVPPVARPPRTRSRFRPGEPTLLEVEIWPTSITLAPGERLRLELVGDDDDLVPHEPQRPEGPTPRRRRDHPPRRRSTPHTCSCRSCPPTRRTPHHYSRGVPRRSVEPWSSGLLELALVALVLGLIVLAGWAVWSALQRASGGPGALPARERAELAAAIARARWTPAHDEVDGVTRVLVRRSYTGLDGQPVVLEERVLETFPANDPGLGGAVHRGDVEGPLPLHLPQHRGGRSRRTAAREDGGMSQVVATAERVVRAPVEQVLTALADYDGTRPRLLPGAVQRLPRRVRRAGRRHPGALAVRGDVQAGARPADVGHPAGRRDQLVETDANSSMVTTWTVHPADAGVTHRAGAHHLERRRRDRRLLRAHLRPEGAAPGLRRDARPARPRAHRRAEPRGAAADSQGPWPGDRRARSPSRRPRAVDALADLVADGDVVVLSGAGPVHRLRHPRLPGRHRQPAPAHPDDLPDVHPRPARPAPLLGAQLRRLAADPRRPGRTTGTGRSATCRRPACSAASSPRTSTACTRPAARRDVVELHGGLDRTVCLDCGDVAGRAELDERLRAANPTFGPRVDEVNPDGDAELPDEVLDGFVMVDCLACGERAAQARRRLLRRDGAARPRRRAASSWSTQAGSLLVLGSSLTVMSGYRFVLRAAKLGIPVAHRQRRAHPRATPRPTSGSTPRSARSCRSWPRRLAG